MIKSFFISLASLLVLDSIWLGFVVKDFNLRQLAKIGRIEDGKFDLLLAPAAISYLIMALAITCFSLPKALNAANDFEVAGWGALLGFIVYGIYDLTNLALLKDYPLPFALADMAWGTVLFGITTWLASRFAA